MQSYVKAKSEPSRIVVIALARSLDVNLPWLATGEGPQRGRVEAAPDLRKLTDVCVVLEHYLAEHGLTMTPEKKGELLAVLYDEADKEHMDDERIARLIRLAV
jgi:hypothetical protein